MLPPWLLLKAPVWLVCKARYKAMVNFRPLQQGRQGGTRVYRSSEWLLSPRLVYSLSSLVWFIFVIDLPHICPDGLK
jgi:hypothetical protein